MSTRKPGQADYERLAALRAGIRDYLAWAEDRARELGTTPAQFQLALAVRADPRPDGPTLTDLAATLRLRHHSVVGLVDRAVEAGLVERRRDTEHGARVHVRLTPTGEERLAELAALHLAEVTTLAPQMRALWGGFG